MARVLLATRNAKKLDELRRILEPVAPTVVLVGLDDVPPYEEVPESGLTFAENALIKAREGAAHTGLPTVADDSGLAVDALNGMPGVFSARWAGRHGSQAERDRANLDLLLAQIADVPDVHRAASFVCVAALAFPAASSRSRAPCAATSSGRRGATAASATTRSSSPTAGTSPTPS
jgi:XTP/dITP diphosphohydrolase